MDLLSQHFVVISYPILTSILSSTVQRLIFLYSESHYSLHYAALYWPVSPHCIAGLCLPLHVSGQVVVERLGCYLAAGRAVGGLPGLDRAPPSSSRWTRHGYSDVLWTFHQHHYTTLSLFCVILLLLLQRVFQFSTFCIQGVPLQFTCHRCVAFTSIHLVRGRMR